MQLAPTPQRPVAGAIKVRGFSLIELMVTVGILAILAALAGPSFQPLIDKWRMTQAIENMKSTMYYARAEAVKRGGRIGIQKNTNGSGCTQAGTKEEYLFSLNKALIPNKELYLQKSNNSDTYENTIYP